MAAWTELLLLCFITVTSFAEECVTAPPCLTELNTILHYNSWLCETDSFPVPLQKWLMANHSFLLKVKQGACKTGEMAFLSQLDVWLDAVISTVLSKFGAKTVILLVMGVILYFRHEVVAYLKCRLTERASPATPTHAFDQTTDGAIQRTFEAWLYVINTGMGSLLAFITLTVSMIVSVVIYFRRGHALCPTFDSKDSTDEERDYDYDAFVLYGTTDEPLVLDVLAPGLEGGEEPFYRLCLRHRDWSGDSAEVAGFVESSRRVIVVLSRAFARSSDDMKSALYRAVKDQTRKTVIVVVVDDLLSLDDLDPVLRMRLNVNAYLKWGEPRFFEKLRCAMPRKAKGTKTDTNMTCENASAK